MDLETVKQESARLGMWAHIATVTPDGAPHVVAVHPSWHEDMLYTATSPGSVKVRNLRHEPRTSFHWQVGDTTGFDSLIVHGTTVVVDDPALHRRLWEGVFDYDLGMFWKGPDDPGLCYLATMPTRAVVLRMFGANGREEWLASTS